MQYPKMSCQLDQRTKVCGDDRKEIRKLRKKGLSLSKIGEMFNLSGVSVHWITNTNAYDKLKKEMRKRSRESTPPSKEKAKEYYHKKMERIKTDPEYYKKLIRYRSLLGKKTQTRNSEISKGEIQNRCKIQEKNSRKK